MAGESPQGRTWRRLLLPAVVALACNLMTGCMSLSGLYPDKPPTGPVAWAATRWENAVAQTHDPANGGALVRGLAGRFYLFPVEGHCPLVAEGTLIVDLYDDRPVDVGGAPVALERWQLGPEVTQQLVRKDAFGWGFSLFLPWIKSYSPDINKVHMQLCFLPQASGVASYASSGPITLVHGERQFLYSSSLVLGKGPPPPAVQPPVIPTSAPPVRPIVTPTPAQMPIHQTVIQTPIRPAVQTPVQQQPVRTAPVPTLAPTTPNVVLPPLNVSASPPPVQAPSLPAEAPAQVHTLGQFPLQQAPMAPPPAGAWLGEVK